MGRLYILGDTTTLIFKHIEKITGKPVSVVVRKDLYLEDVVNSAVAGLLSPKHEKRVKLHWNNKDKKHDDQINRNDVLILCFGYNDAYDMFGGKSDDYVKAIVDKYVEAARQTKSLLGLSKVFINCDVLPPPNESNKRKTAARIRLRNKLVEMLKESVKNSTDVYEWYFGNQFTSDLGTFDTKLAHSEDGKHVGHGVNKACDCNGCVVCCGHSAMIAWRSLKVVGLIV